jgi:hypothetical protein
MYAVYAVKRTNSILTGDNSLGSPKATSSPIQKTRSNTYTKKPRSDTPLRILPDIMIDTESWLSNDMQSTEIFPSGFTPYRKDRKTDSHGSVFILVSDKYLSSEPTDLKSDDSSEQLWVKLQVKGATDLYIGSFYKPPKITDEECLMHLEKNIQRIRQNNNSLESSDFKSVGSELRYLSDTSINTPP